MDKQKLKSELTALCLMNKIYSLLVVLKETELSIQSIDDYVKNQYKDNVFVSEHKDNQGLDTAIAALKGHISIVSNFVEELERI